MTGPTGIIEAPHILVGAVIPGGTDGGQLARLFDIVTSAGAEFTGYVDAVSRDNIPPFEMLSDLADVAHPSYAGSLAAIDWQRTLRVWFSHPAAGTVAIGYGAARQ